MEWCNICGFLLGFLLTGCSIQPKQETCDRTEIKEIEVCCTDTLNSQQAGKTDFLKKQLDESQKESTQLIKGLGICQHSLQKCKEKPQPLLPPVPLSDKIIKCGGVYALYFVKIVPVSHPIDIALTEENAKKFYRQAQSYSASPLYPFIFKAVIEAGKSPKTESIGEFWIQSQPLEERLYNTIIQGGSVNSVSFNDATRVIEELDKQCSGYQFDLPKEEQFVYLARTIYNPANDGTQQFQKCNRLKQLETKEGIRQLLGNQWQLTKSRCEQWGDDPTQQCNPPQSYIKKGGTADSKDATECLPEYRAESTPDVREPNTTLRLILKNPND